MSLVLLCAGRGACEPSSGASPSRPTEAPEPRLAIETLRVRASAGDAGAALQLAQAYARGSTVPMNGPLAVKWYRVALEQDLRVAAVPLADWLWAGPGVPADPEGAKNLYERAVAVGAPEAWERLGDFCAEAPPPWRSGSAAAAAYREAKGVSATLKLGRMHEQGQLVPRDDAAARRLYEAVWARGELDEIPWWDRARAELVERLAMMREEGRGGARDLVQAARAYQRSVSANGRLRYARLLDQGWVGGPDRLGAVQAYAAGANLLLREEWEPWNRWASSHRSSQHAAVSTEPYRLLVAAAEAGDMRALAVRALLGRLDVGIDREDPRLEEWLRRAAHAREPLALLLAESGEHPRTWQLETLRVVTDAYLRGAATRSSGYQRAFDLLPLSAAHRAPSFRVIPWRRVDIGAVETAAKARQLIRSQDLTVERLYAQGKVRTSELPTFDEDERVIGMFLRKAELADDVAQRRRWLEVAANGGSSMAQALLGRSLEEEAPRELAQAYEWYLLAAAGGHPLGRLGRDALGRQLPVGVAARAQHQALERWRRLPKVRK